MAKKFYTGGNNYFYIEDSVTGVIQESFTKDAFIWKAENVVDSYHVRGTNIPLQTIALADIVDVNGVAFADINAFKTFYENFNSGGGSPQYSTSEIIIGKTFNGKNIYSKYFEKDINNVFETISFDNTNLDIRKIESFFKDSEGLGVGDMSSYFDTTSRVYVYYLADDQEIKITNQFFNGVDTVPRYSQGKVYIKIEYLKTTEI